MYKFNKNTQMTFSDFNQPLGLKMNESNRWIKKAELIPWEKIEVKYAELFKSNTGMPAKPLRMALGSLLIQKKYGYSDEELVEQLRENPYYQYFIGMPGYEDKYPFVPSLLVEFRKRLSEDVLNEVNEIIITSEISNEKKSDGDNSSNHNNNDNSKGGSLGGGKTENTDTIEKEAEVENRGTLIIDATCAPQIFSTNAVKSLKKSSTKFVMSSITTLPVCTVKMQEKITSTWQSVKSVPPNAFARPSSSSFSMFAAI